MAQREQQVRTVISEEIRQKEFDSVTLNDREVCPEWAAQWEADIGCRRFKAVYRGVYLNGMLLEHANAAIQLTVFHVGHEGGRVVTSDLQALNAETIGRDAVWFTEALFNRESDVLILFMPGAGLAPTDESEIVRRTHSLLFNHGYFAYLDYPGDSAAAYFTAHVKGFLDRHGDQYSKVTMVGRSGGGWATTFAAALDPRIRCSVSFFGTLPLRTRFPLLEDTRDDLGDFEQYGLHLYKLLDYTDLYALSTSDKRTHVQVYNERDDCCFSGFAKGATVPGSFSKIYPANRLFHTEVLPQRTEADHYNLDATALAVVDKHCPAR